MKLRKMVRSVAASAVVAVGLLSGLTLQAQTPAGAARIAAQKALEVRGEYSKAGVSKKASTAARLFSGL